MSSSPAFFDDAAGRSSSPSPSPSPSSSSSSPSSRGGAEVSAFPALEEHLLSVLSREPALWQLRRSAKEECIKPKHTVEDVPALLHRMLHNSDLGHALRNVVFASLEGMASPARSLYPSEDMLESLARLPPEEVLTPSPMHPLCDELDYVLDMRRKWALLLQSRIQMHAEEMQAPLVQPRTAASERDRKDRELEFAEELLEESGQSSRVLYDARNLLEFLRSADSPNHTDPSCWHTIRLELATPSMAALKAQFAEMDCKIRHYGLDDHLHGWFKEERVRVGQLLRSSSPFVPFLREYAKRGIPPGHRPSMWTTMLGAAPTPKDRAYFKMLLEEVERTELLVDDFVRLDVTPVADDPNFFVFEEDVLNMSLAFLRDKQVPKLMSIQPAFLRGCTEGGTVKGMYPPCGVTPCSRLTFFLAPIFFLEEDPDRVYFLFRRLYCRYFCRLQAISTQPDTILPLCKAFEDMLITHEADLVVHLLSIGVQPLDIAFPWIFNAFAGYLEIDQLFHLWDRILGFDSLLLLPCLAAALFIFRSDFLLEADSAPLVVQSFQDLSRIQVVPLLQSFLFGAHHSHSRGLPS